MKKCTLTYIMWLHSPNDDECPYFDEEFDSNKCESCKWYKDIFPEQEPIDPEIQKVIDEHFIEMI